MWWAPSEQIDVYLSPACIGLANRRSPAADWIETQGLGDALAHAARALARPPWQRCGRVRIWLASTLARPLTLSGDCGARDRREAEGLASMLAAEATGIDGPVRVWADAWRASRGGLAVVMADDLWNELQLVVARARGGRRSDPSGRRGDKRREDKRRGEGPRPLRLVSVRPWWNQALDVMIAESLRSGERVGWSLAEGGGVVHGVVDNGWPVETGFDSPGRHDADGSLLRRRLQVRWEAAAAIRHLDFTREGGAAPGSLGGWREAAASRT